MKTKLTPVMVACWLVMISAQLVFGQSPKWKFKVDDTYQVALKQTTNIKSQIDQRVKTVENELTINFDWKSWDLSMRVRGNIECSISSIQMQMESMPNGVGKSFDIDTNSEVRKKGAEQELLQKLMPLINTKFVVDINESGEIEKVVIPEESLESLRKVLSLCDFAS